MAKNHIFGLILIVLFPFLREISGSTTLAPAKQTKVTPLPIPAPPQPEETSSYIKVEASVYFPEEEQTDGSPFITADGSKINGQNPGRHRWLALSRNLLARWGGKIDYGDSVKVVGISPQLDGVYVVRDAMHRRIRNRVDILVGSDDNVMGFWKDVKLIRM